MTPIHREMVHKIGIFTRLLLILKNLKLLWLELNIKVY